MANTSQIRLIFALAFLLQIIFSIAPLNAHSRVVRVGIFPAPPLVIPGPGKPSGLFIDLLEYFAANQNWQIEYSLDSWNNCLNKLEKGEIDLLPAVSYTKERELKYGFSKHTIYMDSGVVFTSSRFQPHTIFDLQGKRVAALQSSIFTTRFIDLMASFGIRSDIVFTTDNKEVMEAIATNKADAGVCIYSLGNELAKEYPVTITAISFSPLALQFAVPLGKNHDIIAGINQLMANMIDDPDSLYSRSFKKWTMPAAKKEIPVWVWGGLSVLVTLGFLLLMLNTFLRRQVRLKTQDLSLEISEKERALQALYASNEINRVTFDLAPLGIAHVALDGKWLRVNDRLCEIVGYEREELQKLTFQDITHSDDLETDLEFVQQILAGVRETYALEKRYIRKDGSQVWIRLTVSLAREEDGRPRHFISMIEDIATRKLAEAEHDRLETQLRQAQKIESVGKLAGGIAHDYNNMLSVIMGYTEMALDGLDQDDAIREHLTEVLGAAQRSVEITRQLLAFARKQTIDPRVLNLNDTIAGMLKMLQRLIGENISLSWNPKAGLWLVKMDPSQIDQILANLCVNARDAIADVGKITIETDNIILDEYYCVDHVECHVGEYIMLSVSDTGCGMGRETVEKIFEPFFTTKEVGRGTGLSMSTVYGIVKQNCGSINIYSEPGQGTTIKIYIPRFSSEEHAAEAEEIQIITKGTGEVLLLVEDEPSVRKMGIRMLKRSGYTVLAAASPSEALDVMNNHDGKIDMLITDVIMPEMNGRQLADQLQGLCPGMKLLFMSGYTANAIAHHGVLDEGVNFIQKPFSQRTLTDKVYMVLHGI